MKKLLNHIITNLFKRKKIGTRISILYTQAENLAKQQNYYLAIPLFEDMLQLLSTVNGYKKWKNTCETAYINYLNKCHRYDAASEFIKASNISNQKKSELLTITAHKLIGMSDFSTAKSALKFAKYNALKFTGTHIDTPIRKKHLRILQQIEDLLEKCIDRQSPLKRGMIYIDMANMPYSIGECYYAYEAAICHFRCKGIAEFDICFIAEPDYPARIDQNIYTHSYYERLMNLVRTADFLEGVHTTLIMGNRKQFKHFINTAQNEYICWPPIEALNTPDTHHYKNNVSTIVSTYENNGCIPLLEPRIEIKERMQRLILSNTKGEFPVCVHLRVNKDHPNQRRNSKLQAWFKFFKKCQNKKLDVKFFIICGEKELQDNKIQKIGKLQNICLVKNHATSVAEDFALCSVAGAFMGGPSGPSVAAMYSSRPYIFFNYKIDTNFHFIGLEKGKNYPFAQNNQTIIWEPENTGLIYTHFIKMYEKINKKDYFKEINSIKISLGPMMRSIHVLK